MRNVLHGESAELFVLEFCTSLTNMGYLYEPEVVVILATEYLFQKDLYVEPGELKNLIFLLLYSQPGESLDC